jgi:hypothetical protein
MLEDLVHRRACIEKQELLSGARRFASLNMPDRAAALLLPCRLTGSHFRIAGDSSKASICPAKALNQGCAHLFFPAFAINRNGHPIGTVGFEIRRRVGAKIEIADRLGDRLVVVPCGYHDALIGLVRITRQIE